MRALAVLVAALALAAVTGAPAWAHASLVSSSPTQGELVEALPARVVFTFSEDMSAPAYVIVTAPDGSSVTSGDPVVDGAEVSQSLGGGDLEGTYTMAYRAVSADGHPVTGQLTFDVGRGSDTSPSTKATTPPARTGSAAAAATTPGGSSSFPWTTLGVPVVLFGAAAVLFALSRRRSA